MLSAGDPLPKRPQRVLVAGTSGSGKTTLAARIGEVLTLPHVEIDGLFHGPDWTKRTEFEADVEAFTSRLAWVTEWQYPEARALLAERADLLVWLDLPRWTVMRQVVRRTLRRRLRRQRLWNDNIEPPLHTFFRDPDHIVRWAWNTHHTWAERVVSASSHLVVVRLRWLAGPLTASGRGEPAGGQR